MRAALYSTPRRPEEWLRWSFDHLDSHDRIRAAILKRGLALPGYPIDPVTERTLRDFLEYNEQLHTDMNGALRLQGADLLSVDFRVEAQKVAWIALHAREHEAAELALGI